MFVLVLYFFCILFFFYYWSMSGHFFATLFVGIIAVLGAAFLVDKYPIVLVVIAFFRLVKKK